MNTVPRLLIVISLALTGSATLAHTGACHFHGNATAPESTVKTCANKRKASLLQAQKLEASWGSVEPTHVKLGPGGPKGEEWRVIYDNPDASNPAKRRLFMFFTAQGNFIAANHSGK